MLICRKESIKRRASNFRDITLFKISDLKNNKNDQSSLIITCDDNYSDNNYKFNRKAPRIKLENIIAPNSSNQKHPNLKIE